MKAEVTTGEVRQFKALRKLGHTYEEIGLMTGRCPSTVRAYASDGRRVDGRKQLGDYDRMLAKRMRLEGLSYASISRVLGCTHEVAREVTRELKPRMGKKLALAKATLRESAERRKEARA